MRSEPGTRPLRADEAGFWLPEGSLDVVDVYFGDRRVFSFDPRGRQASADGTFVPWPPALMRFLDGHTRLRVVEHLSGKEVLAGHLQLGGSDAEIAVVDKRGRGLAVDKYGHLERMFDDQDGSHARALAEQVAVLVRDMNDFGVCAFAAYGTLLGAVREGKIIGHDIDADTAYLATSAHPADIALESFALERFLVRRGWTINRLRIGLIQALYVDDDGHGRHIDIFVGTVSDGHFYLDRLVEAELDRSTFEPLGTVTLEGVEMAAPARPHALLEATYGPDYMTPNPAFAFEQSWTRERTSRALMGNYRFRRRWWIEHQRDLAQEQGGRGPSPFVRWADEQEHERSERAGTWLDVGCGSSTAALWLARHGHTTFGLDYATPSLRRSAAQARRTGVDARFLSATFHDTRAMLAAAARVAGAAPGPGTVVCRDVLDVVDREARENIWLLARGVLHGGGRMYATLRSRLPEGAPEEPGFRRRDPERVFAEARAHGASSWWHDEDGLRTRMVLTWA